MVKYLLHNKLCWTKMFVTKLLQYHAYLNSTANIDENGFVSNFPMSIIVYSILNGCDGETLHLIISSRDFHFNFVLICLIVGYWTIKPARWHFSFNYLLRSNCVFFTLIRINSFGNLYSTICHGKWSLCEHLLCHWWNRAARVYLLRRVILYSCMMNASFYPHKCNQ